MREWLTEVTLDMSLPSKGSRMCVSHNILWVLVDAFSSSVTVDSADTAEAMFPPGVGEGREQESIELISEG